MDASTPARIFLARTRQAPRIQFSYCPNFDRTCVLGTLRARTLHVDALREAALLQQLIDTACARRVHRSARCRNKFGDSLDMIGVVVRGNNSPNSQPRLNAYRQDALNLLASRSGVYYHAFLGARLRNNPRIGSHVRHGAGIVRAHALNARAYTPTAPGLFVLNETHRSTPSLLLLSHAGKKRPSCRIVYLRLGKSQCSINVPSSFLMGYDMKRVSRRRVSTNSFAF